MPIHKSFLSMAVLVFLGACNSNATDDTFAEPSRDARIDSLASAACERYSDTGAGCPGFGTSASQKYASKSDCEADFHTKAADLWPADRCSSGRIDNARYESCEERAKSYACSSGLDNAVDAIQAVDECRADKVCIDPV